MAEIATQEKTDRQKTEWHNSLVQLRHEIDLLRQVPEMKAQRLEMEEELARVTNYVRVLDAGYDPITVPSSWYVGYLSRPTPERRSASLQWNRYNRALPLHVIHRYKTAQQSGLFKVFTVHSPNTAAFSSVTEPQRMPALDPLLVGWVGGSDRVNRYGHLTHPGQSFLIAVWDLASDLAAEGLILPERAGSSEE